MAKNPLLGSMLVGFIGMMCVTNHAMATIYYDTSLENTACDSTIQDSSVDGKLWDTFQGPAAYPLPAVRCSLTPPAGSRYVEWLTIAAGYDGNGRCTPANNNVFCTTDAGVEIAGLSGSIANGTTIYLGFFARYDRVSSRDVWLDTGSPDSWDKCIEFHAGVSRWGIGCGWPSSNYTATDGRFTFDMWCADSVFDSCQTGGNPDHKIQNDNGYSSGNPFLASYGKWYAVVIGITMQPDASGQAQLWINGTRVINYSGQTTDANPVMDHMFVNGTIGQVAYDTPDHYIRFDRLLLTDTLTDIQNAGLMNDPESGGGTGGSYVVVLRTLSILSTVIQTLFVTAFLWERRAAMLRTMLALIWYIRHLHILYWIIRYRLAIRRWQQAAPRMLEDRSHILEMPSSQWIYDEHKR